jgi:hypothetical protein
VDEAASVQTAQRACDADGSAKERTNIPGLTEQRCEDLAARILQSEREPLARTDQLRWSRSPRLIEVTAKRMRMFQPRDCLIRRVRGGRSHDELRRTARMAPDPR